MALATAREAGAQVSGNSFLDPWGNHVQVVQYDEVQFTKAPEILRGMGLEGLTMTERALQELREKDLIFKLTLQQSVAKWFSSRVRG